MRLSGDRTLRERREPLSQSAEAQKSAASGENQNVTFTASCAWRGSPTPVRRKPSKLNSAGVDSGLMLLSLLKVLNISSIGMISKRGPRRKVRVRRQSKVKKALSLRSVLRPRSTPFNTRGVGVIGWAV